MRSQVQRFRRPPDTSRPSRRDRPQRFGVASLWYPAHHHPHGSIAGRVPTKAGPSGHVRRSLRGWTHGLHPRWPRDGSARDHDRYGRCARAAGCGRDPRRHDRQRQTGAVTRWIQADRPTYSMASADLQTAKPRSPPPDCSFLPCRLSCTRQAVAP